MIEKILKNFITLILLVVFNITASFSQQNVIFINELMAKNDSFITDDKDNYSDWIELYNNSEALINLSGYYLTDDMDTLKMWKIPIGTTISAKGYLIFWASGDNKNRHTNFKLGVDGETIALVMPDGNTIVDSVKYPVQTSNVSYGRTSDGAKTWIFFEEPTYNKANSKPDSDILPVVINEFMASNSKTIKDETGAYPDWIELYNNSDNQIDISGFYLTDKPKREPSMWRIPNGTKLSTRGFLLIWADSDPKDGPYHTNFNLGKDGDSIAIYSTDGKTLVDMIAFGSQQTDISYGRKSDGEDSWMFLNTSTPGKTNITTGIEEFETEITIFNYPHPFKDETIFEINLTDNTELSFVVVDILGMEVFKYDFGFVNTGLYESKFSRNSLPEGIYFYSVKAGTQFRSGKLIIY